MHHKLYRICTKRLNYFKIFLVLFIIFSFYNLGNLLISKNRNNSLFLTRFHNPTNTYIDKKLTPAKVRLKAKDLLIVPGKVHRHLKHTFNNILFIRQGPFKLPSDDKKLLGNISFALFPHETDNSNDDRIWNQMRYVPSHIADSKTPIKKKLIFLYNGLSGINDKDFLTCPVKWCKVTDNKELAKQADVIYWHHNIVKLNHQRPKNQVWVISFLESPYHTPGFQDFDKSPLNKINWTATYRRDSIIPTPYYKYTPYDLVNPVPERYPLPKRNYASGKTKMAAWFVSNCNTPNDRRSVVMKLSKYIKVDIYGSCGTLRCPRSAAYNCFRKLNRFYKFYLAFENSNCREYITEKFFLNGLSNNVVPVVMGAHPEDYKRMAPPHSFIHVEHFANLKLLGDYLHYLNQNDTAYNEYFAWKMYGYVNTNTYFWCRVCMMAHVADKISVMYDDVYKWWHKVGRNGSNNYINNVCIGKQRWANVV